MLEQLQLAISTLGENRGAEGLHDLLDRHGLAGQLVARGANQRAIPVSGEDEEASARSRNTYQTSPKAPMPTGCKSEYLD